MTSPDGAAAPSLDARWQALTARTTAEIAECEPIYRPTTFWSEGVRVIAEEMLARGLATFKSWPSARFWFYPTYGSLLSRGAIEAALDAVRSSYPRTDGAWFRSALNGAQQAQRDFDVARLAWDQRRWPFDLGGLGESHAGTPPQPIRLDPSTSVILTRPYLNYLLTLAGLSRHVDRTPRRFLELGGGFGVLGEILMSRDPDAVYVNLDIPPLLTVASSYMDTLFGDRVTTYEAMPEAGPIELAGAACLPNWRIRDVRARFDVFVNSYSFQEMEPDVLERYVADISGLEVEWIVSLNSRAGKNRKDRAHPIGVTTPVTSADIVARFEACGYRLVAAYGDPLIRSAAELAILRRAPASSEPPTPQPFDFGPAGNPIVDLRRPLAIPEPTDIQPVRRAVWLRQLARAVLPRPLLRWIRARRSRM